KNRYTYGEHMKNVLTLLGAIKYIFFSLFSSSLAEVRDVVFVIQSQKNSYHTHRAEQKRTELLHQAQTLNQVVLRYTHTWTVLNALVKICLCSFIIILYCKESNVNLHNHLQMLSKFKTRKVMVSGQTLHDDEPTIIHDYAFSQDPYSFTYLDFMAGWALSCPLAKTAEHVNYELPKLDFTMRHALLLLLMFQIVLYIWEEGRGPALTAVNEFCSELHSLSSTEDCAMTVNTLSACGNLVQKEDVFVAVNTCQRFNADRGGCSQTISFFLYSYRMVFSRVALQNILAGGYSCRSLDAADDMVIGMCLTTLGLPVTHSPLFHQVAYTPAHCQLTCCLLCCSIATKTQVNDAFSTQAEQQIS
uniref:Beta 3-glucosyltransferase b n=1 Tax=Sinocyclocheilus grahami TaxID=75366 RepID=A0A672NZS3_SINGR